MASSGGELDERTQIRGEFEELQRQYKHMEAMKKVRSIIDFPTDRLANSLGALFAMLWYYFAVHSRRRRMLTRAWASSRSKRN
jgi:hypothetical protein